MAHTIGQLETPVAIVDLDRLQANIERLQAHLDQHDIANRPHIKTHKIPEIAHMQLRAGAVGITCQKVSEAEVMARAGIDDILIPYNIIGEAKLERLMRLARRIRVQVTADSAYTARGLAQAADQAGIELPVLVEFDSGLQRCGVQSPEEAAALAREIARLPALDFAGLMCYPSNKDANRFVEETRQLLAGDSLEVAKVSGGGSPVAWHAQQFPEITEHRAGTYVYGDRYCIKHGANTLAQCALQVLTTVVSRPTPDRGILDAGSKTLSSDQMGLEGYGLILEYPEAVIYGLSEEHGHVDFAACAQKPAIGERVTVIPNHACVVGNLFDEMVGVRDGRVEVIWPVAARGTIR
jgi:D-serine deaminase-like pyridoxal phosphate-dependent protein